MSVVPFPAASNALPATEPVADEISNVIVKSVNFCLIKLEVEPTPSSITPKA